MRYIAAFQTIVALLVLAALAFVGWKLYAFFDRRGGGMGAAVGAGNWLKEETPLGLPSRGIDAGISAATGRDETLGGFLADIFNPSARAANEMLNAPPQRVLKPVSPYSINPRDRT